MYEEPPTEQCQAKETLGAERWDQGILVDTDTNCLPKVQWTLEEGDPQSHQRKWWPFLVLVLMLPSPSPSLA